MTLGTSAASAGLGGAGAARSTATGRSWGITVDGRAGVGKSVLNMSTTDMMASTMMTTSTRKGTPC